MLEVQQIVKICTGDGILESEAKKIVENTYIVGFLTVIESSCRFLINSIFKLEFCKHEIYKNELDFVEYLCIAYAYTKRLQRNEIFDIPICTRPEISSNSYSLLYS